MLRLNPANGDPATRILIGTNVAIFLLQLLAGPHWGPVLDACALTREGLESGAVWQLVTYQFLHANELHILMNMLGLWFAGRELERVVGTRTFVALYLVGGIVGGLAQAIFSTGDARLIGASGSVCAVLLSLTTLFPSLPVTALIFFVLPVRMRARTLGIGLVVFSILFWLSGLQPGVGHLAHLGGFAVGGIFGWVYRRQLGGGGWTFDLSSRGSRRNRPPPSPGGVSHLRLLPTVDEILEKVLAQGIDSLTSEERRILEGARRPPRR